MLSPQVPSSSVDPLSALLALVADPKKFQAKVADLKAAEASADQRIQEAADKEKALKETADSTQRALSQVKQATIDLANREAAFAAREAQAKAAEQDFADKRDQSLREIAGTRNAHSEWEAKLLARANALDKRAADVASREAAVERREAALTVREAEAKDVLDDLEAKKAKVSDSIAKMQKLLSEGAV